MAASPATLPNLDLLDAAGLKALILSQHDAVSGHATTLLSRESEIEHLKLLIAKLRRMQFGRKSEKLERQIEQLELKLEELETAKVSPHERVGACSSLLKLLVGRQRRNRHVSLCPNICLAK